MQKKYKERDYKGIIGAVLFIILGIVALWDSTNMVDVDSFVFPRVIAIGLIVLSLFFIVWQLIAPHITVGDEDDTIVGGSNWRRLSLILVMVISVLLMPFVGFIVSGLLVLLLLMIISMYDTWTLLRKIIYPTVGIVIVVVFYFLFAKILLVPLPIGLFFD